MRGLARTNGAGTTPASGPGDGSADPVPGSTFATGGAGAGATAGAARAAGPLFSEGRFDAGALLACVSAIGNGAGAGAAGAGCRLSTTNAAGVADAGAAARPRGAAGAGSSWISRVSHPSLPSHPSVPIANTATPTRMEYATRRRMLARIPTHARGQPFGQPHPPQQAAAELGSRSQHDGHFRRRRRGSGPVDRPGHRGARFRFAVEPRARILVPEDTVGTIGERRKGIGPDCARILAIGMDELHQQPEAFLDRLGRCTRRQTKCLVGRRVGTEEQEPHVQRRGVPQHGDGLHAVQRRCDKTDPAAQRQLEHHLGIEQRRIAAPSFGAVARRLLEIPEEHFRGAIRGKRIRHACRRGRRPGASSCPRLPAACALGAARRAPRNTFALRAPAYALGAARRAHLSCGTSLVLR